MHLVVLVAALLVGLGWADVAHAQAEVPVDADASIARFREYRGPGSSAREAWRDLFPVGAKEGACR